MTRLPVVDPGDQGGTRQPGHRAGSEKVERRRARRRRHAADVAGHQDRLAVAQRAQAVRQVDHVLLGLGSQERADDGRDRAPVLVELGRHLRGEQHRAAAEGPLGVLATHDVADPLLVDRVHERPAEAHGDGADSLAHEVVDGLQHIVLLERQDDVPLAVDPLPHADAQRTGDEVGRALRAGPVELHLERHPVGPRPGAGDVDRVLLPGRGDEADPRTDPLDERVGPDRRRVPHHLGRPEHLVERAPDLGRGIRDGAEQAVGQVGVRRQRLAGHVLSVDHQVGVGERAADVEVDEVLGLLAAVVTGAPVPMRATERQRGSGCGLRGRGTQ